MLFLPVSFCLIFALAVYQLRFAKRKHTMEQTSWSDLLGQMQSMDVAGLRDIADCYLHPDVHQLRIEPKVMWETVGGFEGIQRLGRNAEVMLQLAMYAERWNDSTGRVLSEIMRRDAARIRASVTQIEMAMLTRRGLVFLGLEMQEAISSYCLLRARLLGMYGECHAGLVEQLAAAV